MTILKKIIFVTIGAAVIGVGIYAGILSLRKFAAGKSLPDFLSAMMPAKLRSKLKLPGAKSSSIEPIETGRNEKDVPASEKENKKKNQERIANQIAQQQMLSQQQTQQVSQRSISDTQRTLRTIDEINRMNKINQQLQQIQQQSQRNQKP